MKIRVLPSAVSQGPADHGSFLTSYLIDDSVAIDAGSLGLLGDIDAQDRVTDLFLSHTHMDHIAALPIFLESVYNAKREPVTVHASSAVLDSLRRDIFNDRVWPDFISLAERHGLPFLKLSTLIPGRPVEVRGLRLTPVEVDHVVPTLGFVIEASGVAIGIPSDTGPTESYWKLARSITDLRAVFLEASFPDELLSLAQVAKHLTPSLFADEMRKLKHPTRYIAVHIKPRFYTRVVSELMDQSRPDRPIEIGAPGVTYEF